MSLYEVLRVARTATVAEIKRAHLRRVKETHPDKHGARKAEEFRQVQAAYEVLSNAARRERYDATGETGQRQCEAMGMLMKAWQQTVRASAVYDDLAARLRRELDLILSRTQVALDNAGAEVRKLEGVLSRTGGNSLLRDAVDAWLRSQREIVQRCEGQRADCKQAIALAEGLTYRAEPVDRAGDSSERRELMKEFSKGFGRDSL
jgi:curved DNA-binding protein CbpA